MKTSKFNEDFFASVREMEIWKLLSQDSSFTWSETLIDRHRAAFRCSPVFLS